MKEELEKIEIHDPFCHMGLEKDDKVLPCDCTRPKRINALSQLFYTKMEEIISSDEDLPAEHDGAVIQCGCHDMKQLNPAIKRRNELRAEQRSKLSELVK